jgi:O-acetyl-ADP-ribose deacetylase (regulator of RNase III)
MELLTNLATIRRDPPAGCISVLPGDLTAQDTDAIVNGQPVVAGRQRCLRSHPPRRAPALREACRQLGGCPVGEARVTGGAAASMAKTLLASCHRSSLALRRASSCAASPSPPSARAYGFPAACAASVAIGEAHQFVAGEPAMEVRFGCIDSAVYPAFARGSAGDHSDGGCGGASPRRWIRRHHARRLGEAAQRDAAPSSGPPLRRHCNARWHGEGPGESDYCRRRATGSLPKSS